MFRVDLGPGLVGAMGVLACLSAPPLASPVEETAHWRLTGERALAAAKEDRRVARQARNLILFIGDGMGVSTVTAARILEGQQKGRVGEAHRLTFEEFPHVALSKTYSANQQVSDSAPTMTAMVTGVKTRDGMLSIGPEVARCATDERLIEQHVLTTLLELAEDKGLATGIVTTTRITHATPAALYAHSTNRDWESDVRVPRGLRDIARQLVEFDRGDGIEVVLGGGRSAFYESGEDDSVDGWRKKPLPAELWRAHPQVQYVRTRDELRQATPQQKPRLLGLFSDDHLQYAVDREEDEPSLVEMTEKAIEFLAGDPEGYFLMVEAGRIDHGHHDGNAYRALTETIELSHAVARARELAGGDTLIVVTADHSHVFTIAGSPKLDNPILGKVVEPGAMEGEYARDLLGLPYTTVGYANGPGFAGASFTYEEYERGDECERRKPIGEGKKHGLQRKGVKTWPHDPHGARPAQRPDLSSVDTEHPDYLQESAMPLRNETHAGEDVAIYASGPMAYLVHGVMEQHALFYVMREALGLGGGEGR